jgi:hypothetical protein
MLRSRVRRRVAVPSTTTVKTQTKDYEFIKGFNSNLTNDDVPQDQFVYATDAREIRIGKWMTRQGADLLSIPVGEAINVQQTSVTGAADFSFSTTTWFAKKVVATATGCLTALEANIRNLGGGTGTVVLALYTDAAGTPGTEVFRTTIAASALTSSYQYLKGRSIQCPDIANGTTYWVIGFIQDGGSGLYQISTTTNAATAKTSANSGVTWSAQSYDFNVKLSTATALPVKGCIRIKRPVGTTLTFFAQGSNLYSVNEGTGVATSVDNAFDVNATYVRFAYVNDVLYSCQGTTKPRKYDLATTTASSVAATPENTYSVMEHKGLLFYLSSDDVNKLFYTNFGLYETFTSTDFFYVPSPKTGDPSKAMAKLNGNLFIITRNNKYILYGAENATFRLDNAVGQKGTFSQESVAFDETSIYLASDDGIYEFNGAQENNIAQDVLDWWTGLSNKTNTVLELHNNRLYVYYTPNGQSVNTRCKVYHRLYGVWESDDTNTYVARTYSRLDNDNYLLLASNRVGMLMLGEQSTNDYNNMGEPLTYELRTNYNHYQAPAQYKRVASYRPHFDAITGSYSIQVGYCTDYSDSPNYVSVSLSGSGPRFDQGYTFNSGVRFGGLQQVNPTDTISIPGQWRRLQIRYQRQAARQPVSFDGHILAIETQRLI